VRRRWTSSPASLAGARPCAQTCGSSAVDLRLPHATRGVCGSPRPPPTVFRCSSCASQGERASSWLRDLGAQSNRQVQSWDRLNDATSLLTGAVGEMRLTWVDSEPSLYCLSTVGDSSPAEREERSADLEEWRLRRRRESQRKRLPAATRCGDNSPYPNQTPSRLARHLAEARQLAQRIRAALLLGGSWSRRRPWRSTPGCFVLPRAPYYLTSIRTGGAGAGDPEGNTSPLKSPSIDAPILRDLSGATRSKSTI